MRITLSGAMRARDVSRPERRAAGRGGQARGGSRPARARPTPSRAARPHRRRPAAGAGPRPRPTPSRPDGAGPTAVPPRPPTGAGRRRRRGPAGDGPTPTPPRRRRSAHEAGSRGLGVRQAAAARRSSRSRRSRPAAGRAWPRRRTGSRRRPCAKPTASSMRVHPGAEAEHVGVVVLAGELGGLRRPGQRRADAGDLVRGDLLAVARAADHDAEAAGVADGPLRRAHHVHGVVVFRVVAGGTAVDRLVAGLAEPRDQSRLELEAGMVRSQVYAHRNSLPERPRSGRRWPLAKRPIAKLVTSDD